MAQALATLATVVAQAARDKVNSTLILTAATMPWWAAALRTTSEIAAQVVPLVLVLVTFLKLYNEWSRVPKPAAAAPAKAPRKGRARQAATAALEAAVRPSWKRVLYASVAVIGVIAVSLFTFRSEAKAAPAPAAPSTTGRRKPNDHAGDEGAGDDTTTGAPGLPADYLCARALIGTREALPNGRANPAVQRMFSATKGWPANSDSRKIAWCMIFVNWCRVQSGKASTDSAMARSPTGSRLFRKLTEPHEGCVVVFWRGSHNDGQTGHVGYFVKRAGGYIHVLGGNQGDAVNVAKFHQSRLLGYYTDRSAMASRTNQAAIATGAAGGSAAVATTTALVTAADPPAVAENIDAAKQVLQPVQETLSAFPRTEKIAMYVGIALAVLTVAGALYVLWKNSEDWRKRHPVPG